MTESSVSCPSCASLIAEDQETVERLLKQAQSVAEHLWALVPFDQRARLMQAEFSLDPTIAALRIVRDSHASLIAAREALEDELVAVRNLQHEWAGRAEVAEAQLAALTDQIRAIREERWSDEAFIVAVAEGALDSLVLLRCFCGRVVASASSVSDLPREIMCLCGDHVQFQAARIEVWFSPKADRLTSLIEPQRSQAQTEEEDAR